MSRVSRRMRTALSVLALAASLGLSGCVSPNTRLPTFGWTDSRAERIASEYHDPLPESDVGPATSSRPRGFTTARSEPRRTLEGATRIGFPDGSYRPASRYPATVVP